MIEEIQNNIITALSGIANTKRYFGELSDPKSPELTDGELPLILVDFVGDSILGNDRTLLFNIYFVHISYSANEETRGKKIIEATNLINEADKALLKSYIGANVELKSLKKIYDSKSKKGYLTIFTRQIGATYWLDFFEEEVS